MCLDHIESLTAHLLQFFAVSLCFFAPSFLHDLQLLSSLQHVSYSLVCVAPLITHALSCARCLDVRLVVLSHCNLPRAQTRHLPGSSVTSYLRNPAFPAHVCQVFVQGLFDILWADATHVHNPPSNLNMCQLGKVISRCFLFTNVYSCESCAFHARSGVPDLPSPRIHYVFVHLSFTCKFMFDLHFVSQLERTDTEAVGVFPAALAASLLKHSLCDRLMPSAFAPKTLPRTTTTFRLFSMIKDAGDVAPCRQ